MVPKTSTCTTAWSFALNSKKCRWTWNVKWTIQNAELVWHKPGSPGQNWWPPTTSQLHFFALKSLYLGPVLDPASQLAVPTLSFLQNCKIRVARKPSIFATRRNRKICNWPWNVKSTMVATSNFAASPFFHCTISTQDHLRPSSWWLSQRCDSGTATFAAEIWSQMSQMTNTDCKKSCGTSLLRLQQWHPCKWQDQDVYLARQIYHRILAGVEIKKYATVVT